MPRTEHSCEDEIPQKVTRTRSWERAVVFDPKDNSVNIRKKRDMDGLHGILKETVCKNVVANAASRKTSIPGTGITKGTEERFSFRGTG